MTEETIVVLKEKLEALNIGVLASERQIKELEERIKYIKNNRDNGLRIIREICKDLVE